ncbi:hypothetical protein P152DRAFT_453022 [Eremomyces bilateralis CBS 781.70]|uniref:Uncharacterized protein n=1 Tax=Eremomyces bilateralis CBS 781.70 TaxID=1392243 RepID=A0A6G1FR42_9PEZI|nr:uncharacterized protein P152DRAFT_453022 [Eremomyces bilateralis CBS 781.70]KAF1808243.1 hypothetical protein P152DRAFT_453022 [Eremomyces bilateralis CBS 781.70]
MAYYDNNNTWGASTPTRQGWEQPAAPSRSGNSSTVNREPDSSSGTIAFLHQFEVKSGKPFPPPPARRDSMPMMPARPAGPAVDYGMASRHSVAEFDGGRPGSSSNLQSFYANQRYGPRTEGDPAAQAKRRAAAARERELRNYHQEQQYNRSTSNLLVTPELSSRGAPRDEGFQLTCPSGVVADVSGNNKSDRSMSPNTMSEDERRELIARQHRALYGNDSSLYTEASQPPSQDARVATAGIRGHSPLAFDPYYGQNPPQGTVPPRDPSQPSDASQPPNKDAPPPQQSRSRANSTSSPASTTQPTTFSLFDNANPPAQQSSRTSTSSPAGSPTTQPGKGSAPSSTGTVAPIGTRPAGPPQSKRATTPGLPSPLSFGYNAGEGLSNERSTSATTSSAQGAGVEKQVSGLGAWGNNGGVWGTKSGLGMQAGVAWS